MKEETPQDEGVEENENVEWILQAAQTRMMTLTREDARYIARHFSLAKEQGYKNGYRQGQFDAEMDAIQAEDLKVKRGIVDTINKLSTPNPQDHE